MNDTNTLDPAVEGISEQEFMDSHAEHQQKIMRYLRNGVWLYFWLLIFEGALRKWFLPGLAAPLLIVRDPVAIWLIVICFKEGIFLGNSYTNSAILLTFFSFLLTLIIGHGDLTVALYGARIMLIQFPVLFIVGRVFTYEDVIKLGKVLLMITPFMTVLMALQFYSPQSAWVNRGLGGDLAGAGFSGAMGFFRPPGTFSFITGLAAFYGITAAYIIFFLLDRAGHVSKWKLLIATTCLLAAIPLSISRTLLFEVVVSVSFAILASSLQPGYLPRILMAVVAGAVVIVILSNFGFFTTATEAFADRFQSAGRVEGGIEGTLGDRLLGGMLTAVTEADERSLYSGKGLGMGTNAGAKLMTGNITFLIAEEEWGRIIGEMGLLLGLSTIIVRFHLVFTLGINAFNALKAENFLPWMLMSFALGNIMQGQWAQPATLGFSVFSGGLIIAALKKTYPERPYFHTENDISRSFEK